MSDRLDQQGHFTHYCTPVYVCGGHYNAIIYLSDFSEKHTI
uniref:Uncharacterized protein n=1 Tax=Anguilla anguilla TaxID=7936 RepID=A0A0E9TP80_ANGAN